MESKLREEIEQIIERIEAANDIAHGAATAWCPEEARRIIAEALLPLLNRAKEEGAREMREEVNGVLADMTYIDDYGRTCFYKGKDIFDATEMILTLISSGKDDWQDIGTAPKDGTWVLTWTFPHASVPAVLYWDSYYGEWLDVETAQERLGEQEGKPQDNRSRWEPTHWRPLPAAPLPAPQNMGGEQ